MHEHEHRPAAIASAITYMADHEWDNVQDQYTDGTIGEVTGDAGIVRVGADGENYDGPITVDVQTLSDVNLWSATFSPNVPRALILDAVELAEMAAKVAGQPALRPAKPCRPWSVGCTDGQAGVRSHYSHA